MKPDRAPTASAILSCPTTIISLAAPIRIAQAGISTPRKIEASRKDSRSDLFKRYDELASEARKEISAFAQSVMALGEKSSDLSAALQAYDGIDATPLLSAISAWDDACDSANMQGLVAQMSCPDGYLREHLARARGALVGGESFADPASQAVLVTWGLAKRSPQVLISNTDELDATLEVRMLIVRDELTRAIRLSSSRLNDPASTQQWVSHRIDERSNKVWAKVRVWWRGKRGKNSLPSIVPITDVERDTADHRVLAMVATPLSTEKLSELLSSVGANVNIKVSQTPLTD